VSEGTDTERVSQGGCMAFPERAVAEFVRDMAEELAVLADGVGMDDIAKTLQTGAAKAQYIIEQRDEAGTWAESAGASVTRNGDGASRPRRSRH